MRRWLFSAFFPKPLTWPSHWTRERLGHLRHTGIKCRSYMRKNHSKVLNQYNFMSVFSLAWYHAMIIPNLISAFRTTGGYSLNQHTIKRADTAKPNFDGYSLAKATGLAFTPLYSPAHRSRPRLPLTLYSRSACVYVLSRSMPGSHADLGTTSLLMISTTSGHWRSKWDAKQ